MWEQSQMNKVARQKYSYNHSSGSKLFLQRQHDLAEEQGLSVDRLELFRETHALRGQFFSHAAVGYACKFNLILSYFFIYTYAFIT